MYTTHSTTASIPGIPLENRAWDETNTEAIGYPGAIANDYFDMANDGGAGFGLKFEQKQSVLTGSNLPGYFHTSSSGKGTWMPAGEYSKIEAFVMAINHYCPWYKAEVHGAQTLPAIDDGPQQHSAFKISSSTPGFLIIISPVSVTLKSGC